MKATQRLQTIENSLRAAASHNRHVVTLEAFELFIAPGAQDHLTFAVPLAPDPPGWTPHIGALQDAFAAHGKRPRLEFFQELHPRLAPALEQAGFVCEMRAPVMALDLAAQLPAATPSVPAGYRRLDPDDEPLLRRYLQRQSVAFGGAQDDPSALDWLPTLRAGLHRGTVMGAVLQRGGRLLTGAIIQIGDGIGELAGVWTDPRWRRQGLAYALCWRLLSDYARAGYALCWLSAAEGALRLYEKLGFATIGTQLNYGRAHHGSPADRP